MHICVIVLKTFDLPELNHTHIHCMHDQYINYMIVLLIFL